MSLLVILLLLGTQSFANDDSSISCSTHECGGLAKLLGVGLGGLVVFIAPHLLNQSLETKYSIGLGQDDLKEANLEMRSDILNSTELFLLTGYSIQLYNNITPSLLRFGIGSGYRFQLNPNFLILLGASASVEKIENIRKIHIGPELKLDFLYSLDDDVTLEMLLKSAWYKKPFYKISTGASFKKSMNYILAAEKFIMLSYQEYLFLETQMLSIDVGFKF